jgi:hypothetical protein
MNSYPPLTTSHVVAHILAASQTTNNTGALIAAAAGFLGTMIGAAVTVVGTKISTHAENLRQERQLAAEELKHRRSNRGELERQVRDAAVRLSDAWASVIQAHDRYRSIASISSQDADKIRTQMVEALTRTGSQLNGLLVLPINKVLEAEVFAIDTALDSFRRSLNHPDKVIQSRNAVSPTILELFKTLREGDVLRNSSVVTEVAE